MQYCFHARIAIIRNPKLLLFLAQLPAAPSSARVSLWRRLRSAGAASLLNGAWVLPRTREHINFFSQLTKSVRAQRGTAQVLAIQETNKAELQKLILLFQTDRIREYDEFEERTRRFLAEIKREIRLRKFTFAELEEIEDDLEKLTAWLEKIRARDFFPDKPSRKASRTLKGCQLALKTFAKAVYAHEGIEASDNQNGHQPKSNRY